MAPAEPHALVPPVPGGFRYANESPAIASDGRFTLVAFSHAPAASVPCTNCGSPRLRGLLLDATGQPLDPYGFPIAEAAGAPLRAVPLDGRFLVGWTTTRRGGEPQTFSLSMVRGGDGAVVAKIAPPVTTLSASLAFDLASDGRRAVVVWKTAQDAIVASVIDGQVTGDRELTVDATLCASGCSTPHVAFQSGPRFVAGFLDRNNDFVVRELTLGSGRSLSSGWEQRVNKVGPGQRVAMGATGETSEGVVLVTWNSPNLAPAAVQRFRASDGMAIGPPALLLQDPSEPKWWTYVPAVARAGNDLAILMRLDFYNVRTAQVDRSETRLMRVRPGDGAVLDKPALVIKADFPPAASWNGSALDLVWVGPFSRLKRARLAPGATQLVPEDLGRTPEPQQYPGAAALGDTVLATFDGFERIPSGETVRALQAVRLRSDGTAIDTQPIRIALQGEGSWGAISTVAAGAGQFLVAWFESGFTRGPKAVRAARVGADGRLLGVVTLDDQFEDGLRTTYIAKTRKISAVFDGQRFRVSWARWTRPGNVKTTSEAIVAAIDPTSGAVSQESLGELAAPELAGASGRLYGLARPDPYTNEEVVLLWSATGWVKGPSICETDEWCQVQALGTDGRSLLGLWWVHSKSDPSVIALEMGQIDLTTGAVLTRTPLFPGIPCTSNGGAIACQVRLSQDGDGFLASAMDTKGVGHAVRIRVPAQGAPGLSAPLSFDSKDWGMTNVVPTSPGHAVLVYDAIDSLLDWRRIYSRSLRLSFP